MEIVGIIKGDTSLEKRAAFDMTPDEKYPLLVHSEIAGILTKVIFFFPYYERGVNCIFIWCS